MKNALPDLHTDDEWVALRKHRDDLLAQLDKAQAKLQRYEAALRKLSSLGNEPLPGNSIGNRIAQEALYGPLDNPPPGVL